MAFEGRHEEGAFVHSAGYTTVSDATGGIPLLAVLTLGATPSGGWAVNGGANGRVTYSGPARHYVLTAHACVSTASGPTSTLTLRFEDDGGTGAFAAVAGAEACQRMTNNVSEPGSLSYGALMVFSPGRQYRIELTSSAATARYVFDNVGITFAPCAGI